MKGPNRYQLDRKIGSGTFGTVHRARDKKTLMVVAIKRVFQDKNYKNRELDILRVLKHPNVLAMRDSFLTQEDGK
jgi:serine/threonine protein kinase